MPFLDFTAGQVLTAAQVDELLMRQTVMVFDDAAARTTALSGVLTEGMITFLKDTDSTEYYDGSSWQGISNPGDITAVNAGTALTGGGTSGDVTLNVDETALTIAQSQVTNLTTDLAGKQDDVITTRGDLVVGNSSGNPARLGRGTADQVLTSNGTDLVWADAGGGGSITQLATTSLSGASTTISSIDQSYEYLIVKIIGARIDTNDAPEVRLNSVNSNTQAAYIQPDNTWATNNDIFWPTWSTGQTPENNQITLIIYNYSLSSERSAQSLIATGTVRSQNDGIVNVFGQAYQDDIGAITSLEFQVAGNWTAGTVTVFGVK